MEGRKTVLFCICVSLYKVYKIENVIKQNENALVFAIYTVIVTQGWR